MNTLKQRESDSLFRLYRRYPIEIESATGCTITAKDGTQYLDFLSGLCVNALGHSNDKVIDAITRQVQKYMHVSNYLYQEPQVLFAEKLKTLAKYHKVFLCNSGTEANEGAMKLLRRHGALRGKTEIIAFTGGFHGRTMGTLSLMDKPHYKDKMGPFLDNIRILPYNDVDALEEHINENTAGVVLEFIQGEGGVVPASPAFIQKIFELKEKNSFLVLADEIQTGAGRTGKFFSFEHYDVRADIVTMAKAIGGGLPLGAILTRNKIADTWELGMHGTTFGGNPLSCVAGLVVLEELENGLMHNVQKVGKFLHSKLCDIAKAFPDFVKSVRGKGLLLGLELSFEASELVYALFKRGIISNATNTNVLRIIPPLIITEEECDRFAEAVYAELSKR